MESPPCTQSLMGSTVVEIVVAVVTKVVEVLVSSTMVVVRSVVETSIVEVDVGVTVSVMLVVVLDVVAGSVVVTVGRVENAVVVRVDNVIKLTIVLKLDWLEIVSVMVTPARVVATVDSGKVVKTVLMIFVWSTLNVVVTVCEDTTV